MFYLSLLSLLVTLCLERSPVNQIAPKVTGALMVTRESEITDAKAHCFR